MDSGEKGAGAEWKGAWARSETDVTEMEGARVFYGG